MESPNVSAGPQPLSLLERRILGVLIEKQKTTPDAYPMSLNGLTVGCNQKSNRDPVMSVTEEQVENVLEELNRKQLVVRVVSGRVDKWKHVLYEQWGLDKSALAVLAELFLRGPQTEGELRSRVSRMDPLGDLDALRHVVGRLKDRGFAVYLTPEGRRGTIVGHRFVSDAELSELQAQAAAAGLSERTAGPAASSGRPDADELRKELADLRSTVSALADRLSALESRLGDRATG
jgi:uncharacterized protein YceH (UPF0502 family)